MESLPDLVILEIFKRLDFKDFSAVSCVCSRFNCLSSSEILWKRFCKTIWILEEVKEFNSWKHAFISHYKKYGKYAKCYKSIKSAWNIIEEWLLKNCPEIYESLNSGIDEELLEKFEYDNNLVLPSDFKLSYMLHNGQKYLELGNLGLFGGILLPNESYLCASLYTFETAITKYSINYPCALPITCSPILKYAHHQVVSHIFNTNRTNREPCEHSSEVVLLCNDQYRSVAFSFSEWFSQYAKKLANDEFLVKGGRILSYDKATEEKAVTNHITVTVRWAYNEIFNAISLERNLYSYIISMKMPLDAPQSMSCKLASRHWAIEDRCGTSETVDGEGVVGHFPVMQPGAEFTWASCTSFHTDRGGSMKGYFTMQNLINPDITLNVKCPEFVMTRPSS